MKGDHEKLRKAVKKMKDDYGFRGLLHFTDFSNLSSIINIGYLCNRALCYANNIDFKDACLGHKVEAANDVKNCTRFYYIEKNKNCPNMDLPVYLLFSEEIIYFDLSVYSDGDADSMYTKFGTEYEFFANRIDWDSVFDNKQTNYDDNKYKSLQRKKCAELLIDEPVPIKYLKNIIFRCSTDYKRACSLFGKNKIYLVEPEIFFNEKNFIKDYSLVYNETLDSSVFILHFCSNIQVENFENNEYRLYDLDDNLLRTAHVQFPKTNSTYFSMEINKPNHPVKFKFLFNGILSIEETIG